MSNLLRIAAAPGMWLTGGREHQQTEGMGSFAGLLNFAEVEEILAYRTDAARDEFERRKAVGSYDPTNHLQ